MPPNSTTRVLAAWRAQRAHRARLARRTQSVDLTDGEVKRLTDGRFNLRKNKLEHLLLKQPLCFSSWAGVWLIQRLLGSGTPQWPQKLRLASMFLTGHQSNKWSVQPETVEKESKPSRSGASCLEQPKAHWRGVNALRPLEPRGLQKPRHCFSSWQHKPRWQATFDRASYCKGAFNTSSLCFCQQT